ncbi:hypothetical protein C7S13_8719 [Burkholderia cepacia]|nr:hypothetical protein [Burkholderia cepacia]
MVEEHETAGHIDVHKELRQKCAKDVSIAIVWLTTDALRRRIMS